MEPSTFPVYAQRMCGQSCASRTGPRPVVPLESMAMYRDDWHASSLPRLLWHGRCNDPQAGSNDTSACDRIRWQALQQQRGWLLYYGSK